MSIITPSSTIAYRRISSVSIDDGDVVDDDGDVVDDDDDVVDDDTVVYSGSI